MTTELFHTLRLVAATLSDLEQPWALIGGLATSTYVEPRFTRDIDLGRLAELLVGEERAAAQQAIRLIEERGYDRGRDLGLKFDEFS